jgi:hypothetical protein
MLHLDLPDYPSLCSCIIPTPQSTFQFIFEIMAEVDDSLFNRAEIAAQRDRDDLLDRLDVLLERYLHTLHEYQKVMQELTKQLSSVCDRNFWMEEKRNADDDRDTYL